MRSADLRRAGSFGLRAGACALAGLLALLLPAPHARAGLTLPPGAQGGSAKTYHISGGGSVGYSFSSPAGQADVAECNIPAVNSYAFNFDGTLDTPSMTLSGAITQNVTQGDLSDPYSWAGQSFQCGTPYNLDKNSPQNTVYDEKAIVDTWYYIQPASTFRGSYQLDPAHPTLGTYHLFGQVQIVGKAYFDTCDQMKAPSLNFVHQDCSAIYRYASGQNSAGINITASIVMDGSLAFEPPSTGNGPLVVQMLGNVSFSDSDWPCCVVPGSNGEIDGTPQP